MKISLSNKLALFLAMFISVFFVFGTVIALEDTLDFSKGWNMVSIYTKDTIDINVACENKKPMAFEISGGRIVRSETLESYKSYLLRLNKPCSVDINGEMLKPNNQNLVKGWNIIFAHLGDISRDYLETQCEDPQVFALENINGRNILRIMRDDLHGYKTYLIRVADDCVVEPAGRVGDTNCSEYCANNSYESFVYEFEVPFSECADPNVPLFNCPTCNIIEVCCCGPSTITCEERNGMICADGEECIGGDSVSTPDSPEGACCVGGGICAINDGKPDLIVTSITTEPSPLFISSRSTNITVNITNNGNSTDEKFFAVLIFHDSMFGDLLYVDGIDAGQTIQKKFKYIPILEREANFEDGRVLGIGNNPLSVKVDFFNAVDESNENNNILSGIITVNSGDEVDTTPPSMISSVPADQATDVGKSSSISIRFSEWIDIASVQYVLKYANGESIDSEATFNSNTKTLVINPSSDLGYDRSVQLDIIDATDAAGNHITAPISISFTVESEQVGTCSGVCKASGGAHEKEVSGSFSNCNQKCFICDSGYHRSDEGVCVLDDNEDDCPDKASLRLLGLDNNVDPFEVQTLEKGKTYIFLVGKSDCNNNGFAVLEDSSDHTDPYDYECRKCFGEPVDSYKGKNCVIGSSPVSCSDAGITVTKEPQDGKAALKVEVGSDASADYIRFMPKFSDKPCAEERWRIVWNITDGNVDTDSSSCEDTAGQHCISSKDPNTMDVVTGTCTGNDVCIKCKANLHWKSSTEECVECTSDSDCDSGETCGSGNTCVDEEAIDAIVSFKSPEDGDTIIKKSSQPVTVTVDASTSAGITKVLITNSSTCPSSVSSYTYVTDYVSNGDYTWSDWDTSGLSGSHKLCAALATVDGIIDSSKEQITVSITGWFIEFKSPDEGERLNATSSQPVTVTVDASTSAGITKVLITNSSTCPSSVSSYTYVTDYVSNGDYTWSDWDTSGLSGSHKLCAALATVDGIISGSKIERNVWIRAGSGDDTTPPTITVHTLGENNFKVTCSDESGCDTCMYYVPDSEGAICSANKGDYGERCTFDSEIENTGGEFICAGGNDTKGNFGNIASSVRTDCKIKSVSFVSGNGKKVKMKVTTAGNCTGYKYLQVDASTSDKTCGYVFDPSDNSRKKGIQAVINDNSNSEQEVTGGKITVSDTTSESIDNLDSFTSDCEIKPDAACLYLTNEYVPEQATGCLSSPSKLTGTFTVSEDATPPSIDQIKLDDSECNKDNNGIYQCGTITTQDVTLSATTDEDATCKYDTQDGAYASMPDENKMEESTTKSHTASLTGLSDGAHNYYIRCRDDAGNEMTNSRKVTFTVQPSTFYKDNGESCSSNDQCISGYCVNGVCSATAGCTSHTDCSETQWCNSGTKQCYAIDMDPLLDDNLESGKTRIAISTESRQPSIISSGNKACQNANLGACSKIEVNCANILGPTSGSWITSSSLCSSTSFSSSCFYAAVCSSPHCTFNSNTYNIGEKTCYSDDIYECKSGGSMNKIEECSEGPCINAKCYKDNGESCSSNNQCASGYCVNGVCSATAG